MCYVRVLRGRLIQWDSHVLCAIFCGLVIQCDSHVLCGRSVVM